LKKGLSRKTTLGSRGLVTDKTRPKKIPATNEGISTRGKKKSQLKRGLKKGTGKGSIKKDLLPMK